jgi:hypothetical protein
MTIAGIRYVHDDSLKDRIIIEIDSGDFAGIQYTIGEVSFPDGDEPILHFNYDIIKGSVVDKSAFEKFVGDTLVKMIEESLRENTTVFKGGI